MQETCRATLQYSHSREQNNTLKAQTTDWYCGKVSHFRPKYELIIVMRLFSI